MSDIIDEAYQIVQCKECPWYKACVTPMKFTSEDLRRQLEQGVPGANPQQTMDAATQNLLSSMALAAQNSLLEACPVLIQRLRANPKLSQKLKEVMLNWGSEEKPEQLKP